MTTPIIPPSLTNHTSAQTMSSASLTTPSSPAMSPSTVNVIQSSLAGPRLIGATTAGILELLCFHPIDTIAKRLMNNREAFAKVGTTMTANVNGSTSSSAVTSASTTTTLRKVIFKEHADSSILKKWSSLFPGLGFAAGYKVSQRVYKFGGQPFVNDFLSHNFGDQFRSVFGARHAATWQQATAGSLIGVGEVLLLPLDNLKIKAQTSGKPILPLLLSSSRPPLSSLYAGAGWTAARNAPGSFALFGGNALAHSLLAPPGSSASHSHAPPKLSHHTLASILGATLSIIVSAPMDVVKTRVQAAGFTEGLKGWEVVRRMIRDEGLGAFWKGCVPKLFVVGPKLVFSFTIAQYVTAHLTHIAATRRV